METLVESLSQLLQFFEGFAELIEYPCSFDHVLNQPKPLFLLNSPRDLTPEATYAVIDRSAPGLAEAMRSASLQVTPHAMLSRATAGIRKSTLILNLPGNPSAAVENLQVVLPVLAHAVQLLRETPDAEAGHNFSQPS